MRKLISLILFCLLSISTINPAGAQGVPPSYQNGFACNAGEAKPEYQSHWPKLVGAWIPGFGITGGRLFNQSIFKHYANVGNWNGTGNHWGVGRRGWTGQFNGTDDYINCGNTSLFHFTDTDSFSFVVLMKVNTSAANRNIIRKDTGISTRSLYLFRITDTDVLQMQFGNTGETLGSVTGTTSLEDGEEHLIVGVRDVPNDKLYLYIDGKEEANVTDDSTGTWSVTENNLEFGRNATGIAYFTGTASLFLIYKRALSQQETMDFYLNPLGMFELQQQYFRAPDVAASTFIPPISFY